MAVTQEIGIPLNLAAGEFQNTEFINGMLQLKVVDTDDTGRDIYEKEGYWISEIIPIKDKVTSFKRISRDITITANGSFKIYTQSSNDRSAWTPFEEINPDNTIRSPIGMYARVKIEIVAANTDVQMTIDNFDNDKYIANKFISSSEGELSFNKVYEIDGIKDNSWTSDGSLFFSEINKSQYKKINNLEIMVV